MRQNDSSPGHWVRGWSELGARRGCRTGYGGEDMDSTAALLPTISHTWVEPSAVTIGWWAGTRTVWDDDRGRAAAWDLFRRLEDIHPGGSNMNARSQWYQRAFSRDDGAATVYYDGVGRARDGIMASVRQSWFEQSGLGPEAIMPLVDGWHVSRLDLAADAATDDRLPPADLYARLPAARSRSRPEHRTLTISADGAQKLTIGSRASGRYARIYVKGERVRHEVELKQGYAGEAWQELRGGRSIVAVWADQYGRLVRWR